MNEGEIFNLALENYRNRQFKEAIELLEKAVEMNPNNVSYRTYMATCHWYLLEFEKAEKHFEAATLLDSKNPWPFFCQGQLAQILGKMAEALELMHKAVELELEFGKGFKENNGLLDLFIYRSAIYEKQRLYMKAVEEYDQYALHSGDLAVSDREIKRLMMLMS